jgi:rhodanese-related sulfurtransferase
MKRNGKLSPIMIAAAAMVCLALILPVHATLVKTAKDFTGECRKNIKESTLNDALAMFKSGEWIFVDVRSDNEFKQGHIPKAKHVDRGKLEFIAEKQLPDKSAKIVLYCKVGDRSALAACTLKQMGYVNVVGMEGGWEGWLAAGNPVE